MYESLESEPRAWKSRLERVREVASGVFEARWRILWALLIGASPAYALFPLVRGSSDYLIDNSKLSQVERLWAVGSVFISLVSMGVVFGVFHWIRKRRGGASLAESLRAWNHRTCWILVLPWIPVLFIPQVETKLPWLVISAAAAMATLAMVWAYQRAAPAPVEPSAPHAGEVRKARRLPLALVTLGAIAYAAWFSFFSIQNHHALGTRTFDLGIYDNILWLTGHGNLLGSSFLRSGSHVSAHFDPILILFSPLYLLYPRAEFLLVLQSVWLALGAVPLYVLARRKLDSAWVAAALVLVYLLYPALHGANMYDFHSLTLAGPLLVAGLAALELGAIRTYCVFVGLLLLTREDLSLVVSGIGLYAIFALGRKRLGMVTIGVAVAYLATVKLVVMPDPGLFMKESSAAYGYAYYYKDLIPFSGEGSAGLLGSLLLNPLFVLKHVTTEPKLQFLFLLFLPLLFLPLLQGGRRTVGLAYGMVFLFLSSRAAVHSTHFQYTTVLYPLAVGMVPPILAELPRRRWFLRTGFDGARMVPALALGMAVATAVLASKFGGILPNASFRGGFTRVEWSVSPAKRQMYAWIAETVASLPPDASVSATGRLGPHVSNRRRALVFPREADYLFVHQADLDAKGRKRLDALKKDKGYGMVSSFRDAALWKKGAGPGPEDEPAVPAVPERQLGKPIGSPLRMEGAGRGASVVPIAPMD